MQTDTIYWQAPHVTAKPAWLDGCNDVCQSGVFWWVGSPLVHPNFDKVKWHTTASGWKCSSPRDDFDLTRFLRSRKWTSHVEVVDGSGRVWFIPALLAPDGTPCVIQSRVRIDGKWVRKCASESQEMALEAAIAVRNGVEMTLEEQTDNTLAMLEIVYHLDADTLAVLGLVDDALVYNGWRQAAGMLDDYDAGD